MKKLEWLFSLQDRLSGVASKMLERIDSLNKSLKKVDDTEKKLAGTSDGLGTSMRGAGESARQSEGGFSRFVTTMHDGLGVIGMVGTALSGVVGWIERTARAALGGTRAFAEFVLQVGGERESAITGMATVMQDRAAAANTFRDSLRLAQMTPFETADVVRDRTALVLAGFTAQESRVLYGAAADIRTAMNDPARGEVLMRAFTRIRGEGGISGRILEELTAAGVGRTQLFAQLAAREGRTFGANQQRQLAAWAEARLHAFDANQSLNLIIDTIEQRVTHTGIGGFARAQSTTINGILSNLASLPHDILSGLNIESIPGVQSFKKTMLDFLSLFNEGNEVGARFQRSVSHLIDALFGSLFSSEHGSRVAGMSHFIDGLSKSIESVARSARTVIPNIRAFFDGFTTTGLEEVSRLLSRIAGNVSEGGGGAVSAAAHWRQFGESIAHWIASVVDRIGKVFSHISSAFRGLDDHQDMLTQIGARLGRALGQGLLDAFRDAAGGVGQWALEHIGAGNMFDVNAMAAGGPQLTAAARARLAAMDQGHAGGGLRLPAVARGGGTAHINVNQTITVGPGATPQMAAGAAQIAQGTVAAVRDHLRRVDLGGNQ